MPKSKSKSTARAARSAGSSRRLGGPQGLPVHPAMASLPPLLAMRMGKEDPLRLPDSVNEPTAATVLRSEYTVSSDAAGSAVFGESCALVGSNLTWVVTAGSTGVAATGSHPQYTAFVAEAKVARMVAMKVQVTYIGADLDAAGYISYLEKANASDASSISLDALHTGSIAQHRAKDGMVSYVDFTQTPRWEVPTSATFMLYTFPLSIFVASGLPASKPVLRVRVTRFMEYMPVEGALAEGELMHEPFDGAALAAHGEVSGPGTSVHPQAAGPSAFMTAVKGVANAAYHMAQPVLHDYVVPKARQYLADRLSATMPLLLTMG